MSYDALFGEAKPGQNAWVYVPEPGTEEWAWVGDSEYFDDCDDPVTVTRQRWHLLEEQTVTFHPLTELCPQCHGEEEVAGMKCGLCLLDPGRHPLAGQMEVHE